MTKFKKHVLILSATHTISGAEIVLKPYVEQNKDYRFTVYTSNEESIATYYKSFKNTIVVTDKYMKNYLLRTHPLRLFKYIWSLYKSTKRALQLIKTEYVDVIYGNNSNDLGLLIMLKMIKGDKIKVISHVHNHLSLRSVGGLWVKGFGSRIDQYLVPSKVTRDAVLKLRHHADVKVVYNGVELSNLKEKELSKPYKFAFVGTLNERKRPDLFLEIIKSIHHYKVPYEAVILGGKEDQTLYKYLLKTIDEEGLNVKLIDHIDHDEMEAFYSDKTCVILTSDDDPLPTVLIEAMNQHVFVVARDVGGVKEIIQNGIDGIVFPMKFQAKYVAKDILKHLENPEPLQEVLKNAHDKVRTHFSNDLKVDQVNGYIKALIEEKEKTI